MKNIFLFIKYIFIINLFLLFSCNRSREILNDKNICGINSQITEIANSIIKINKYNDELSSFMAVSFFSENENNYIEFVNSGKCLIDTAKLEYISILNDPNFIGLIRCDLVYFVFFNECSDSVFNKFINKDLLDSNTCYYDSIMNPANRNITATNELKRRVYQIKNDSLIFLKK